MGRKVYMSVLGTSLYDKVTYAGSGCSVLTRFVQEATLKDIGVDDWGEGDAVYIFLTEKARKDNWGKDITQRKNRDGNMVEYSGLELALERMNLRCAVQDIDIVDGKNESEMWEIFNVIYSLLEDGDELYFDLTHGFRSLPMLLLVLGNYAKFLKNTKMMYMSYGNYEARKDGIVPIVDLLPLASLQDWTSSASSFRETGRVDMLRALLKEVNSRACDKNFKEHLQLLQKNLKSFQLQMETCSGKQICEGKAAEEISAYAERVMENSLLPAPTLHILNSVKEAVLPFKKDSSENIRSTVLWCKKYGLIQQGYTMCQEGTLTLLCEKFAGLNPYVEKDAKKQYRQFWSSILGISGAKIADESQWLPILQCNRELARSIFSLDWVRELRKRYVKLTGARNHINHGGFTGEFDVVKIKNDFDGIADEFLDFCGWEITGPEITAGHCTPVFINLSNHPVSRWSEKQRDAAREYGNLVELPFPDIDPEIGDSELGVLVDEYFKKVLAAAEGKTATVHLMGEMTFTCALVNRLKEYGIRCVASTSERVAEEDAEGNKTSSFGFVRFRNY